MPNPCFAGLAVLMMVTASAYAQPVEAGRQAFVTRCAACHGTDGNGGELGPAIAARVALRTDDDLRGVLRTGFPGAGMPAFTTLTADEVSDLIAFVRTLRARNSTPAPMGQFTLTAGGTLDGRVMNQTHDDIQVLGNDRRLHLLRVEGERHREVTSQADWPSYNGSANGSRYSALSQIDSTSVARLAPKWMFSLPNTARLQVTPVVVGGVMYVTAANECWALDAGSGREIWHYQRARTKGIIGVSAGGVNRASASPAIACSWRPTMPI